MDRPKRVTGPSDPGYPTLATFSCDRRGFLHRMALSGVSIGLGGGLLAACDINLGDLKKGGAGGLGDAQGLEGADAQGWEDGPYGGGIANDAQVGPDEVSAQDGGPPRWEQDAPIGGDDVGPRWEPETSPPEPDVSEPLSGGAPMEQLFDLRLPETGLRSVYIADDGYLRYAIALKTYDEGFYQGLATTQEAALAKADAVLATFNCEDVEPASVAKVEQVLREALELHYAESVGYSTTWIQTIELRVESCEVQEQLDGDMPDPRYP